MSRFVVFAGALALGLLSSLPGARAQDDREQARVQFERGVGLYESHDYAGALEAFQEAYRLAPHPTVRVNMANCYEHLDRPIEAIHHFQSFLAESPNAPRPQRREVEDAITRLRRTIGEVRLAVAPDGARIVIDDAETRRAPVLEPILMTVGSHTVVVTMDGYRTARETINIQGGETQRVSIRLERGVDEPVVAVVEPPVEPTPVETSGGTQEPPVEDTTSGEATAEQATVEPPDEGGGGFTFRLTPPVIIFGASTAALGIGAIVTGALAIDFNNQFEDAVLRVNSSPPGPERRQARADGESAASTANALSITTDVLIIATIAAAGATAFFVIIDGMREEDEAAVESAGVRAVPVPMLDPNGGGVAVVGSF